MVPAKDKPSSLMREHLLQPLDASLPFSLVGSISNISSVFTILLTRHVKNYFLMSVEWSTMAFVGILVFV